MKGKLKKISAVLLLSLLIAFAAAATGCTDTDYSSAAKTTAEGYSAEKMTEELDAFLENCKDRTALSRRETPEEGNGEQSAAEYIAARLETLTGRRGEVMSFRRSVYDDEFDSGNVVFSVKSTAADNTERDKVIIGTHYDNTYSDSLMGGKYEGYAYFKGTKAEGAMSNGTSVAILLRMCEYFANMPDELDVDVDFVFYGMGCIDYGGAEKYYESLGTSGREDIRLAITLDNIGGDNLYMYFDETPTAYGKFIMGVSKSSGYENYVSEPPATQVDLPIKTVDSLPYTPYELLNEASVYFDNENVCVVTSGSDNTFLLYKQDGYGKAKLSGTSSDTRKELSSVYSDYAEQMSVVADLLTRWIKSDGFAAACSEKSGSYGFWTSTLAAYITCAVLGAVLFAVTIIVVSRLRKKYAEPELKRNVKIAVFGMDYEEPSDGDIFFDIRSADDPFSDAFDKDASGKDGSDDKKDD